MMHRPTDTTRCRPISRTVAWLVVPVIAACAQTGCRQSPITENDVRSPFDRYDLIRDEYAAPYLQDEYGRKRPNLRGRLIDRR
jgi:hypothetical protein